MIKMKAFALSAAVFFACGAMMTASAFSGGDGSADSPYEIANVSDLAELAQISLSDSLDGTYFIQTENISTENKISAIAPNSSYPFKGSYNGAGKLISNAELGGNNECYGLFLYAEDAELSNITITGAKLNASSASGGVAGKAYGKTKISGCSFDGTVIFKNESQLAVNVGGIVGKAYDDAVITRSCSSLKADMTKSPFIAYIGGIAGSSSGTISECISNSEISAVSECYLAGVGGIAGENCGNIAGSVNNGSLSGKITNNVAYLYLGGIAGSNNSGTIERTVNNGNISGIGFESYPGYIGGIVGYNICGSLSVSHNAGLLSGSISYAGGVSGINYAFGEKSSVTQCMNNGKIAVSSGISGGIVGGNIASSGTDSKSVISSSLNLADVENGSGAVGSVTESGSGISEISGLIVRNVSDSNAQTMTDDDLIAAEEIASLSSSAWVYPDGFYPSLAVVKNLSNTEIIATALDKENGKAAFTIYNPASVTNAVAVFAFYSDSRLIGTKIYDVSAEKGYSVHTVQTGLASAADCVKIMLVGSVCEISPLAEAVQY